MTSEEDRMLKWFRKQDTPTDSMYNTLACYIVATIPSGPERTVALRKLLESKDCAVRAEKNPGG